MSGSQVTNLIIVISADCSSMYQIGKHHNIILQECQIAKCNHNGHMHISCTLHIEKHYSPENANCQNEIVTILCRLLLHRP